jgi:hypothetical protein
VGCITGNGIPCTGIFSAPSLITLIQPYVSISGTRTYHLQPAHVGTGYRAFNKDNNKNFINIYNKGPVAATMAQYQGGLLIDECFTD